MSVEIKLLTVSEAVTLVLSDPFEKQNFLCALSHKSTVLQTLFDIWGHQSPQKRDSHMSLCLRWPAISDSGRGRSTTFYNDLGNMVLMELSTMKCWNSGLRWLMLYSKCFYLKLCAATQQNESRNCSHETFLMFSSSFLSSFICKVVTTTRLDLFIEVWHMCMSINFTERRCFLVLQWPTVNGYFPAFMFQCPLSLGLSVCRLVFHTSSMYDADPEIGQAYMPLYKAVNADSQIKNLHEWLGSIWIVKQSVLRKRQRRSTDQTMANHYLFFTSYCHLVSLD